MTTKSISFSRNALIAVVLLAGVAWAHAILVASVPEANSIVDGPSFDVALKFNVRIDARRSLIRLVSADGAAQTLDLVPGNTPNVILAKAKDVRPGKYKLSWQALASDGHITRGEIPFSAK